MRSLQTQSTIRGAICGLRLPAFPPDQFLLCPLVSGWHDIVPRELAESMHEFDGRKWGGAVSGNTG